MFRKLQNLLKYTRRYFYDPLTPSESKLNLEKVKMRLSVWDNLLGVALSEEITLPIIKERDIKKVKKHLKTPAKVPTPVYAGADTSTPLIAQIKPRTVVRTTKRIDSNWWRVELKRGLTGFIKINDAELVAQRARKKKHKSITNHISIVRTKYNTILRGFLQASWVLVQL